jgi:WD40 repeat protein
MSQHKIGDNNYLFDNSGHKLGRVEWDGKVTEGYTSRGQIDSFNHYIDEHGYDHGRINGTLHTDLAESLTEMSLGILVGGLALIAVGIYHLYTKNTPGSTESSGRGTIPPRGIGDSFLRFIAQFGLGPAYLACYSPDGRWIAIASSTGLYIHDARTNQILKKLDIKGKIENLSFSPLGTYLTSLSYETIIWKTSDFTPLRVLNDIEGISFSPDEKLIAMSFQSKKDYDKSQINIMEFENQKIRLTLKDIPFRNLSVTFSPDGKLVAVGARRNADGQIHLWDMSSKHRILSAQNQNGSVWGITFSSDSQKIAAYYQNDGIRIWNVQDGTVDKIIPCLANKTDQCLAFSPDGTRLAIGEHTNLYFWNLIDNKKIEKNNEVTQAKGLFLEEDLSASRKDIRAEFTSVSFSPDGTQLIVGAKNHTSQTWNVNENILELVMPNYSGSISHLEFSPDGSSLLIETYNDSLKVLELENPKIVSEFYKKEFIPAHFANSGRWVKADYAILVLKDQKVIKIFSGFSPDRDSNRLALYSLYGSLDKIAIVDHPWMDDEKIEYLIQKKARIICFYNYGKNILSIGQEEESIASAIKWEKDDFGWHETGNFKLDANIRGFSEPIISPDFRFAAVEEHNKEWLILSLDNFGIKFHIDIADWYGYAGQGLFTPDGRYFIRYGADYYLKIWDTDNGKNIDLAEMKEKAATCVAVFPDSINVITARENKLYFWDITKRKLIKSIEMQEKINAIAISPNGHIVAVGFDNGVAQLFGVDL